MNSDDFIQELYESMKASTSGQPRTFSRRKRRGHDSEARRNGVDDAASGWQPPPGVARSRGVTWRNPQRLSDVVSGLTERSGWKQSLSMGTVVAHWVEIVGPQVAQHCSVTSFEGNVLHVQADSTAWAKQLQLLLPQIERRISETVGDGESPQVVVHGPQPPSWKHGKFAVKGRGPRDTYG